MRTVKRLDLFLLKSFLPLFVMTFGICLFIFLMQFLWLYVDEMVGKGIEIHILLQLFFYAALRLVPQALPLSILFASLMTFGNLGEQFELLALKASGISLLRIMRPLTVLLIFVAAVAFYFQENVIPVSQVKFYTILFSVRQKSPELEIPVKTFYGDIGGLNIYIREKDKNRKLLLDVMIYDYSEGFNNARVIVADSGRLMTSTDKKFLILTLYSGEWFENLKGNNNQVRNANDPVPYRRESFDFMEKLIEFDGNFNMYSESLYQDRYIGKNIASLQQSIDSMTVRLDNIRENESKDLYMQSYRKTLNYPDNTVTMPSSGTEAPNLKMSIDFDSLYKTQEDNVKASLLDYSKRNIEYVRSNYDYKSDQLRIEEKEIQRHHMEMHKKFTLSFACLIFFFIGAPLGAIIRKGGLGAPAVLSVFLFIFYYIFDNVGNKMARDAVWLPWQGMWLSSAVLLPLGIFLTYKAVNDSVILNAETYIDTLKRLIGKREYRNIQKKDLILELPDYKENIISLQQLKDSCLRYVVKNKRWPNYIKFWKQGSIDPEGELIANRLEDIIESLNNSDQNLVLNKLMDFPIIKNYLPSNFRITPKIGITMAIVFPVGGIVYLIAVYRRRLLLQDMGVTAKVCDETITIIDDKNSK